MSRGLLGHTTHAEHVAARWSGTSGAATTALVLASLATVAASIGVRALHNAPVDLPGVVVAVAPGFTIAGGVLSGLAAVAFALRSARATARVGLLFAGVFGSLGTVVPAVVVPAVVALVAGGGLALASETGPEDGWPDALRRAVPVVLLGGVALSLGAATGVLPTGLRSVGSALALTGLAASPALVRPGHIGWVLGALAGGAVLWSGAALPFVAGAVTLVAFGLVGTPLVLFAVGVGGCVATVVGSVRHRGAIGSTDRLRGVGTVLVLLAGAPVSVGGATAVVLGTVLLAGLGSGGDRR